MKNRLKYQPGDRIITKITKIYKKTFQATIIKYDARYREYEVEWGNGNIGSLPPGTFCKEVVPIDIFMDIISK